MDSGHLIILLNSIICGTLPRLPYDLSLNGQVVFMNTNIYIYFIFAGFFSLFKIHNHIIRITV